MEPERELGRAGTDPGCDLDLVDAGRQRSNVKLGTESDLSSFSLSDRGNFRHLHPPTLQYHNHNHDNGSYLPHRHSEPLIMSDAPPQSTSSSGPSSFSEGRTSGSDPTRTPPIGATEASHRTPYQNLPPHPDPAPSDIRRSSSDDQLRKLGGGGPPFSPPFLHPLSLRTKSSRVRSPFSASAQRPNGGKKPKARLAMNSSPPNSPVEPEPKYGYFTPKPIPSTFTIRGFLALSTFSKAIVVLFVCCVLLLLRAFLGIGHSAESCGVFAHEVTKPDLRSGFPSESTASEPDAASNLKLHTNYEKPLDQGDEDERGGAWLEMFDETYGYQYDWKLGEYEIEHEDDGGDRYDDEYEHEDFLDQV